jgi:hypothetical protein
MVTFPYNEGYIEAGMAFLAIFAIIVLFYEEIFKN